jgi:hypothetical protein
MFTMPFRKREREHGAFLNETQRTLINEKFEILQQASFGFTQDRLLHISQEESKGWTNECTDELRREIGVVAPSHVQIVLIEFRKLRCVSFQCRPWVSYRHPSIPERGPVLVCIAAAVAFLLFHVLTAHERRGGRRTVGGSEKAVGRRPTSVRTCAAKLTSPYHSHFLKRSSSPSAHARATA